MTGLLREHLEKLHSFKIIVESGSLRRASEYLRITQPALSRQIQTLEEVLGVPLVDRSNQGVKLTKAGQVLHAYSTRLLQEIVEVESQVREPEAKFAGHLQIGTFESLAIRFWPKVITKCSREFPKLSLSIHSASSSTLYRGLLDRQYDMVLASHIQMDPRLQSTEVFRDSYGFFCTPGFTKTHRVLDHRQFRLAIVPDAECSDRRSLLQTLWSHGLFFETLYQLNTFEAAANYALEGASLAVLPHSLAKAWIRKRKLLPVKITGLEGDEFGHHSVDLVLREDRAQSPMVQAMVKVILKFLLPKMPGGNSPLYRPQTKKSK